MRIPTCLIIGVAAFISTAALAKDRLRIALKQGYDYPYISHDDSFGPAAVSGLKDRTARVGSLDPVPL